MQDAVNLIEVINDEIAMTESLTGTSWDVPSLLNPMKQRCWRELRRPFVARMKLHLIYLVLVLWVRQISGQ